VDRSAHGEQHVAADRALVVVAARQGVIGAGDQRRGQRRELDRRQGGVARRDHRDHQVRRIEVERGFHTGEELGAHVDPGRDVLGDQAADRTQQRIDRDDPVEHHAQRGLPAGAELDDRLGQLGLGREQRPAASRTRRPRAVSRVR